MCSQLVPCATRNPAWRGFLAIIITCLLIAGCSSIALPPAQEVAARGAQATAVYRLGPIFRVRTASVIPGSTRTWPVNAWSPERCESKNLTVELIFEPSLLERADMKLLCRDMQTAISYVKDLFGLYDTRYRFIAYLVPEGWEVRRQHATWATQHFVTAQFVFPFFQDAYSSKANIISTSAHETYHLMAAIAGFPPAIQSDEKNAYKMGACAQFISLGWLRMVDFPRDVYLESAKGATTDIIASSKAGVGLREELRSIFGDSKEIKIDSDKGGCIAGILSPLFIEVSVA